MKNTRMIILIIMLAITAFIVNGCFFSEDIDDEELIEKLTDSGYHVINEEEYFNIIERLDKIVNDLDNNEHFEVLYEFFDEKRDLFPTEDYFYYIYGNFEDYNIDVFNALDNADYIRNILE